jgi:chemotaxis signal transduction protein
MDVITFQIRHFSFALELGQVLEVLKLGPLTPVPCAPQAIAGVVNIRGEVKMVIHLEPFFSTTTMSSVAQGNPGLLLKLARDQLVLHVDKIQDIQHFTDAQIISSGSMGGIAESLDVGGRGVFHLLNLQVLWLSLARQIAHLTERI